MKKILGILILFFYSMSALATNEIAPKWQLKTQNGENISLADYQGKPVILHFWATWCPYCKKLQPKLVQLQKQYSDQDVLLVGISFNEDEGVLPQDEIKNRGYNFITAINGDNVAKEYGVKGTPTTFFINRQGKVVFKSTSSNVDDPNLNIALLKMTQ